jgi:iron complex transport system substrate-binding protein
VHRKLSALLVFLLLLLLGAACGSTGEGGPGSNDAGPRTGDKAQASAYPIVIRDDVGRRVEIESRPERLGSMAPSITETLFAVGAGERVVGVTTADDYPPEVESIEEVGEYRQPNVERVASLGIEVLFLSSSSATVEQAEDLERKTRAKVVVINPESVEDAISSIGTVGKIVGNREEAREVEERLRGELEQIESKVGGLSRPTVFYEISGEPLITAGPGSFVHDVIRRAGGTNVAAGADQAYPQYPPERLLEENPDYYLVGRGSGTTVEEVKSRGTYSALRAVQEDRVFVVNDDLVDRPGPRIVEGVREIAEIIHPDALGR